MTSTDTQLDFSLNSNPNARPFGSVPAKVNSVFSNTVPWADPDTGKLFDYSGQSSFNNLMTADAYNNLGTWDKLFSSNAVIGADGRVTMASPLIGNYLQGAASIWNAYNASEANSTANKLAKETIAQNRWNSQAAANTFNSNLVNNAPINHARAQAAMGKGVTADSLSTFTADQQAKFNITPRA